MPTGNQYVDALAAAHWGVPHPNFYVWFHNGGEGGAWTVQQQRLFFEAARAWTDVANISFGNAPAMNQAQLIEALVTNDHWADDPLGPAIAEHDQGPPAPAWGFYNVDDGSWPNGLTKSGDVMHTFVHEIGHALGLDHPFADPLNMDDIDFPGTTSDPYFQDPNRLNNQLYTVMAYRFAAPTAQTAVYAGAVVTPMAFDIAAIQSMYGATDAHHLNDTYYLSDRAQDVAYRCIWDYGGTDEIRYTGSRDATIDLRSATLKNEVGGGGMLSHVDGLSGGFTIAGDFTNFIGDVGSEVGVIIENASGGSGDDTITGNAVDNALKGNSGGDTIHGRGGNDTILGGADDDDLNGDEGRDVIYGEAGADRIFGGADADKIYGGNGNDETLFGDGGDDLIYGGKGNDILSGGADKDQLFGDANDDRLEGGAGDDVLYGGTGNDVLDGEEGDDTLRGGQGNDIYFLHEGDYGDVATESLTSTGRDAGGIDEIRTDRAVFALQDNANSKIENLRYVGDGDFEGFGNGLDNALEGSFWRDLLVGGKGRDKLFGNSGDDVLRGGDDSDELHGGAGEDRLEGDDGDDWLYGGEGADNLYGGIGADNLHAEDGLDVLHGGAGDDIYLVTAIGDTIVELLDEGNDRANVAGISGFVLAENVENMHVNAGGVFKLTATGNDQDNVITSQSFEPIGGGGVGATYVLYGAGGKDKITGANTGKAGDILDGGEGDDELIGLRGDDVLRGGVGADILNGGANFKGGDTADYSLAAEGVRVNMSLGKLAGLAGEALGDQFISIENITGSTFNDDLTGNSAANVLTGGDGNDILDGGAGIDTLDGGSGDDILLADSSKDIIRGGEGYDQVYAGGAAATKGFKFTLTAEMGIEGISGGKGNDKLDASAATTGVYLVGFEGNDELRGGSGEDYINGDAYAFSPAGNDILYGGAGSDHMYGFHGDDILYGGGSSTTVGYGDRLFGGTGNDTLYGGGIGWVLGEEGSDTLYGADGDLLDGGADGDTITGDGGWQQIVGGLGDDVLTGGGGADLFDFADDWGADRITDFQVGVGLLRFEGVTGLDSFAQLSITDFVGGAQVAFAGNTLLLQGIAASSLSQTDFRW